MLCSDEATPFCVSLVTRSEKGNVRQRGGNADRSLTDSFVFISCVRACMCVCVYVCVRVHVRVYI